LRHDHDPGTPLALHRCGDSSFGPSARRFLMKRIPLVLAALTFAASTASAYVQPSHPAKTQKPPTRSPVCIPGDGQGTSPTQGPVNTDPGSGVNRPPMGDDIPGATNPAPEPGTMVLASMGLLALGTAVRRRRY
jgi:hypothetical protein